MKSLRLLKAVRDHQNISRAAELEHIEPPAARRTVDFLVHRAAQSGE